jgi:hypothetical protein
MVAVIVICFLALTAAAYYFWLRPSYGGNPDRELAPPRFAGLFSSEQVPALEADPGATERLRANLVDRARAGDLATLSETHSLEDGELYCKVLDALIESASDNHETLRALISHVSKSNGLRGNKQLVEHLMRFWKAGPDRRSTVEMMHIAALSDDAVVYQRVVELIIAHWQEGELQEFTPDELIELFESQFWVLAPEARVGGAGFALKRKLASVRSELA